MLSDYGDTNASEYSVISWLITKIRILSSMQLMIFQLIALECKPKSMKSLLEKNSSPLLIS